MKLLVRIALVPGIAAALLTLVPNHNAARVQAANAPQVSLDIQNAAPRPIEDSTRNAVVRDYAAAWQSLAQALDENRVDLLGGSFIGTANDKLTQTIREQRNSGLHQRYLDKGHHVEAVFYSTEGSAMELHDTAQLEIQLMDGDKVVHSQDVSLHYVALLTAAENSWKVRVLEAVPSF